MFQVDPSRCLRGPRRSRFLSGPSCRFRLNLWVALSYRTDANDPRVVASVWESGQRCLWHEVALTFSGFVQLIGLGSPDAEPGAASDRQ
jgi:hypothetical protein